MARNEADITASERLQGGTALHEAAGSGNEGIVKLLLHSGATVDALDNFGATPLHRAAYNGHMETISLLRHHGAHLDHGFYHGAVAKESIEKDAYRECHRQWKAKDWIFTNLMAGSPLQHAVKNGQERTVRLLLSCDLNPNAAGQFEEVSYIKLPRVGTQRSLSYCWKMAPTSVQSMSLPQLIMAAQLFIQPRKVDI